MAEDRTSRTRRVVGERALQILSEKTVAVFGLGGVGGNACDALVRCGVKHFVLVDNDEVCVSNLNRQLLATLDTVGQPKVDVAEAHIHRIDPMATVVKKKTFYLPETKEDFDFTSYDYVVDAIDTVTAKIDLAVRCHEAGTPLISALGCGNKLDPTQLKVCDLFDTSYDPLAKVLRRELKKRGVTRLKVVCSTEPPLPPIEDADAPKKGAHPAPGSTPFVPPVAGILLASEVFKDLTGFDPQNR